MEHDITMKTMNIVACFVYIKKVIIMNVMLTKFLTHYH